MTCFCCAMMYVFRSVREQIVKLAQFVTGVCGRGSAVPLFLDEVCETLEAGNMNRDGEIAAALVVMREERQDDRKVVGGGARVPPWLAGMWREPNGGDHDLTLSVVVRNVVFVQA